MKFGWEWSGRRGSSEFVAEVTYTLGGNNISTLPGRRM